MMTVSLDADQLQYLIDLRIKEIAQILESKQSFVATTQQWLNSKRQAFSGSAYVEQLEKNAVYFVEATGSSKIALVQYLFLGQPQLSNDTEIEQYVDYVGKKRPLTEYQPDILSYVRGYTSTRPRQLSNYDWDKIRHMREVVALAIYLNELTLICAINRVATDLIDNLLRTFLRTPQISGACSGLEFYELVDILNNRINIWALFYSGNLKFE